MSAYEDIDKIEFPTELDLAVIYWGIPDDEYGDEDREAAAQELLDLRARLAKAEELLKRLEFGGEFSDCPICECSPHERNCELDTFLKGASK